MCPKCLPWVNEVCMLWDLNILFWTREEGEFLKQMDLLLIHAKCFRSSIWVGTEHTAGIRLESSHPCWVWLMFQTPRVRSGMDWLCPQVPAVPALPLVSIFMNVYLMTKINTWTWTQFGISNAIGKWFSGIKTTIEWLNPTLFLLCLPQTLSEAIIRGLLGISKWGECLFSFSSSHFFTRICHILWIWDPIQLRVELWSTATSFHLPDYWWRYP